MASLQAVIWQILRDKSDAKLEVATLPQFKHGATPEVAISMIPTASQGFFGMLMQIIILVFWAGRCSNRYIGWATVKFLFVLFLFNFIFIHRCYVLPISVNKDVWWEFWHTWKSSHFHSNWHVCSSHCHSRLWHGKGESHFSSADSSWEGENVGNEAAQCYI